MGPFELIYYVGYRLKTSYDLRRQRRLPARVISVGNITSGGTGKTPAAVALALEARGRGLKPCVLTRGYGGSLRGPVVVTADMRAREAGDEPVLMARKLEAIPVVKCADRHEGGTFALERLDPRPDIFILDDGFQHRRLHRDKDILLVSSREPFDNGKLLPMGLLREPLGEMKRADIVVMTKKPDSRPKALVERIRRYNPRAPIFSSGHRLSAVVDASGERRPADWLKGKDVYAFCGIGEPDSFRDTLVGAGSNVRGFKAFRDHHSYTGADLLRVRKDAHVSGAPWIITTEKDIIRLRGIDAPENLLTLEIEFVAQEGFYDEVFN
ncbi:MAG: tetraacyldisaccharide 4'-kinase [Nitrospirota bacterium]|jgi:tetraacyldisaccharide 4'-kinase